MKKMISWFFFPSIFFIFLLVLRANLSFHGTLIDSLDGNSLVRTSNSN